MHEITVIPSFQRESILEECLKALRLAEPDLEVHVFSDRGYYSEMLGRIAWQYNVNLHIVPQHKRLGNNYIALEIFKWLMSTRIPTTTFYVESDVLIHPDFFTWSRQNVDHVFAVCGWSNPTTLEQEMHLQYLSPVAMAIKLDSVEQIAKSITVNRKRPWDLQITDYLLKNGKHCLFPAQRKVDHAGYQGLNFNKSKPNGLQDTGFVPVISQNRRLEIGEKVCRIIRY